MIAATDPFMADVRPSGIQKGRGGFLRSADDAPYVSDPDGAVCATGARKGEVKRLKYGSPSGVGRLIENDVGLTKYKQRNTLLGIGMNADLAEACRDLVLLDADSDEFRHAADTIVVEADNLTRSWLAADRGSHGHLICQRVDEQSNWPAIIEDGEALGLDESTQLAVAIEWGQMLAANGLEILAIEAACVDDKWRLAGTLDRLVRTTRPLRFVMPGGERVTVPAGMVLVLDIKFGKPRRAHLIQIASYAQSVPYDTDAETRGEWPWQIDQEHALIAHGDFGGDGRPVTIELLWVDLAAGREHGGDTVARAKAWSNRDDLWSVAQIDTMIVPVEGDASGNACLPQGVGATRSPKPSTGTPDPGVDEASAGLPTPAVPESAKAIRLPTPDSGTPSLTIRQPDSGNAFTITDPDFIAWATANTPTSQDVGDTADMTPEHLAAQAREIATIGESLANVGPADRAVMVAHIKEHGLLADKIVSGPEVASIPVTGSDTPNARKVAQEFAVSSQLAAEFDEQAKIETELLAVLKEAVVAAVERDTAPSQGADLSSPEFELLWAKIRHEHDKLPDGQREWVNRLSREAMQANVSFHTRTVQTERSYHLCKALVTLAAGGADDDILEVLLNYPIIERFKSLGHAVGSLGHVDAEKLALSADQWAAPPPTAA